MPYFTKKNWVIPSKQDKLIDLTFRSYHFHLNMGNLDPVEPSQIPIPLRDQFNLINRNNYIPSIMYNTKELNFEGENKLNVSIYNTSEAFRQREFRYMYFDNHMDKYRLNIIDDGLYAWRNSLENQNTTIDFIGDFLSSHINDSIRSEKFSQINIIEYVGHVDAGSYNRLVKSSDSAIKIGQNLSARYRKPVSYHTAETDVVSRSEAINSLAKSKSKGDVFSRAGMRRIEAHEVTDYNTYDSRSYLIGLEYML